MEVLEGLGGSFPLCQAATHSSLKRPSSPLILFLLLRKTGGSSFLVSSPFLFFFRSGMAPAGAGWAPPSTSLPLPFLVEASRRRARSAASSFFCFACKGRHQRSAGRRPSTRRRGLHFSSFLAAAGPARVDLAALPSSPLLLELEHTSAAASAATAHQQQHQQQH